jgi:hypothetical protein
MSRRVNEISPTLRPPAIIDLLHFSRGGKETFTEDASPS